MKNFSGVIDPDETISAGSLTPPNKKGIFEVCFELSIFGSKNRGCGVNDTAL
jgi:hypothetical protein